MYINYKLHHHKGVINVDSIAEILFHRNRHEGWSVWVQLEFGGEDSLKVLYSDESEAKASDVYNAFILALQGTGTDLPHDNYVHVFNIV
jgi:hypothetical protein